MAKRHSELTGKRCSKCNGSGSVIASLGGLNVAASCGDCAGTGLVNSPNACSDCKGSGRVVVSLGDSVGVAARCDTCNGSGLKPV